MGREVRMRWFTTLLIQWYERSRCAMTKYPRQTERLMRAHACTKFILGPVLITVISLGAWTIKTTGAQPSQVTSAPSKSVSRVAPPSFVSSGALPDGKPRIEHLKSKIDITQKFNVDVPSDSQRIIDALPIDKKLHFRNSISALNVGVSGFEQDQALKDIRKICPACTVVPTSSINPTTLNTNPPEPKPPCKLGERYDVRLRKCTAY
jgi:hypothetical protein